MMRNVPGLAALLTIAMAAAACSLLPGATPSPRELLLKQTAEQEAAWNAKGIDDYTFTIGRSCFCPPPDQNYQVTVVDGVAVKVDTIPGPPRPGDIAGLPKTVPEMFALIRGLPADAVVSVLYSLGPGVPTVINVDPIPNAIDDEYTITVFEFTPAS